jgi:RHS repeat-associated protein
LDVSGEASSLLATTWYYYNESGNPTRIVTKPEASTQYSATRFEYAKNGETVMYVLGETWEADGADPDNCPENYDITFAREFRYDSGRARYLNRELDPVGLMQNPPQFVPLTETWTDYDGDESYGDYTVSGGSAANAGSSELGVASVAPWAGAGTASTSYWHNDLIGTLRNETASDGSGSSPQVYSAFGEPVTGATMRYGYVGSWGYQSHDEFPFLHIGARYYDPSIGRFLQRDPIGIDGELNVYSYVDAQPTLFLDPDGEGKVGIFVKTVKGIYRLVRRGTAVLLGRKGKDPLVTGPGASGTAKKIAKDIWPDKKIRRHDGHEPGQHDHYQPKSGGGHVKYRIPGSNLGVSILGCNLLGKAVDFFNPLSDAQDVLDLVWGL